jgi:hypothetical protein
VDIVLDADERTIAIGSLVTDERGAYDGSITVPPSVPIGDYDLRVVPHGASGCRDTAR